MTINEDPSTSAFKSAGRSSNLGRRIRDCDITSRKTVPPLLPPFPFLFFSLAFCYIALMLIYSYSYMDKSLYVSFFFFQLPLPPSLLSPYPFRSFLYPSVLLPVGAIDRALARYIYHIT